MADFPQVRDNNRNTISVMSSESIGWVFPYMLLGVQTPHAWPTANKAYFIPFRVANPFIAIEGFWFNGTAGTDNVDIGIYGRDGTRLVSSGTTASSGANSLQKVSLTSTTLEPGVYYMAIARPGTTNTIASVVPTAGAMSSVGVYEMATAFPLPSTATFATSPTAFIPSIGISNNSTL